MERGVPTASQELRISGELDAPRGQWIAVPLAPALVRLDAPRARWIAWHLHVGGDRGQGTPTEQRDAEVGFKVFGTMVIRAHGDRPR